MKKVFKVTTGCDMKEGYARCVNSWNVIAEDGEEAVNKIGDLWQDGEVLESVELVCVIDLE